MKMADKGALWNIRVLWWAGEHERPNGTSIMQMCAMEEQMYVELAPDGLCGDCVT